MRGQIKYIFLFALLFALSGCKSWHKVVEVPVPVHDTTYLNKVVHDSTYIDRWHSLYMKGDTVFVTNEQITVKLRTITDTAYTYVEKPVTVTVEQIKEVKKPLAWWQKTFICIGVVSLVALLGVVVWKFRKWWSKLK